MTEIKRFKEILETHIKLSEQYVETEGKDLLPKKLVQMALPQILSVSDYHELEYIQNVLKELGLDVVAVEVAFNGRYIGVLARANDPQLESYVEIVKQHFDSEAI